MGESPRRFALGADELRRILAEYGITNPVDVLPRKGRAIAFVNTMLKVRLGYPVMVRVEIATGTGSPKSKYYPAIVGYFVTPQQEAIP